MNKKELTDKDLLRIDKEISKEGGEAAERLKNKCRWEQMGRLAVLKEWGDPREWR